jgi:hypothetical protein
MVVGYQEGRGVSGGRQRGGLGLGVGGGFVGLAGTMEGLKWVEVEVLMLASALEIRQIAITHLLLAAEQERCW